MAGLVAWTFVALALVATVVIGIEAARRRILLRMAVRNAARRPRQTATVIAGLMIGTAIISAAIVAGQSAGSAIRGQVYTALGPIDETVRLDAFNYFPDDVVDAFRDDPRMADWFDGISPNLIWDVAVTNPRTDLFEPRVATLGFDAVHDAAFGDFEFVDGTSSDGLDLPPGGAYITKELAQKTDSRVGDTLELRFTPPMDPLIPNITRIQDTLTIGIAGGLVPGEVAELVAQNTHPFTVDPGVKQIVTAIAWDPRPGAGGASVPAGIYRIEVTLEAPDGSFYGRQGLLNQVPDDPPAPPVWVNVTDEARPIPVGEWQLHVRAPLALDVDYVGAAVVLYPIYDATELQQRIRALQDEVGGGTEGGEADDLVEAFTRFDPFGSPESITLTVAGITDGGRGDQFGFEDALFFHASEAQQAFHREGEVNLIKLSNPGDTVTGRAHTDEALDRINATLEDLRAQFPDDGAIQNLEPHPVKRNFIRLADDAGQLMTGLLLFAGSLSVITGLLLIINIFTMLAEERRTDLGMSRAVGMTRRDLVRLFLFEGSLYAVGAAAIGSVLGLGLAALLVAFLNAVLANLGSGFPPIPLKVTADALLVSFASGALLTFATIAVASRRISRLNIVRAIRRVDEPEKTGTILQAAIGGVVAAIGIVAAVLGWAVGGYEFRFTLQVFGPLLFILGTGLVLKRTLRKRYLFPSLAAVLATYYAFTYFLISKYDNIEEANIVGPIRGVILTLCVVVMFVYFERGPRLLGNLLGASRRWRAVALPAMAYPQHKRFRTGMTLAMFSIVILSIGFFSIFGGLFQQPIETQTGGFHIEATTTLDVEDLAAYDRGLIPPGTIASEVRLLDFYTPDVELLAVEGERTGQFSADVGHHVYGIDQAFVDAQDFRLLWRLPEYEDDDAAYQAVLDHDDLVIVAYPYSTDERNQDLSHEVGETLNMRLGDEVRDFTIVGIQEQYHFVGVFLNKPLVESLFPTSTDDMFLYKLPAGADSVETAKLLEQNYREVGMNAESSEEKVRKEQETFRQILGAMKLFLGLGLLVGVLSLGIVTSRSVLERRQEIGMMRALGFTAGQVRSIFLTEVTFVVFAGAVIGVACSILVSFGLWFAVIRELQYPYSVPWGEIGVLLAVSYLVALAATLAPIRRAAKVAPAEALRYIE